MFFAGNFDSGGLLLENENLETRFDSIADQPKDHQMRENLINKFVRIAFTAYKIVS